MKFFLLAGGYGKRAKPLSLTKPKPLFPLNDTPLINLMISQLKAKKCTQGFINLHHLSEKILSSLREEPHLTFIQETELSGSRVLKKALPSIDDLLLVINGDTYMEIPLEAMERRLKETQADGILVVRRAKTGYPGLLICNGFYHDVPKEIQYQDDVRFMYTGMALFTPKVIERIREANFFNTLQKNKFRIACIVYKGIWLEIGTPMDYFASVWKYKKHIGDTSANAVSPGVSISSDSLVHKSIIWEGVSISAGSVISRCIVSAHVHLTNFRAANAIITPTGVYPLS